MQQLPVAPTDLKTILDEIRVQYHNLSRAGKLMGIMIADQDAKGLSALPGVGPATAERIIAKLRRKMCKFALIAQREETSADLVQHDVVQDTFHLLTELGHSESEARKLLDDALATNKKFKDVDALMHAVYQTTSK